MRSSPRKSSVGCILEIGLGGSANCPDAGCKPFRQGFRQRLLGPNGRYIAGIIERTRKADLEEIEKLRAAWEATREAARGATRGMLTRDLITPEQYKILTDPWISVFGEIPAAPEWKGPGHIVGV